MNSKLLFKAAIVALLFSACSSEENANSSNSKNPLARENSESGLSVLQNTALSNLEQRFTFRTGRENISFRSESGVTIDIDGSSLTLNGRPATGTLTLVYAELFDYAHMITSNKTTMGITDSQGRSANAQSADEQWLKPLESGGEFYLNVVNEKGESLDENARFTLTVPVELTGRTDGDVVWDKDLDGTGQDTEVPVVDEKYVLDFSKFGWCNIDKYKAYTGPKTTISVIVPSIYNDSNAAVYLAVEGAQNTIAPLDTFDTATNAFGEHYGEVPIGLSGHLIFVSEDNGDWLYAIKSVTFTSNGTITISSSDISTATESSLIASLSALP
jgi:hypothetical protein